MKEYRFSKYKEYINPQMMRANKYTENKQISKQ